MVRSDPKHNVSVEGRQLAADAESITTGQVNLDDDDQIVLGANDDYAIVYDSTDDRLEFRDKTNSTTAFVPRSGSGDLSKSGIWTEDGNSPFSASGANSINPSIATGRDIYFVFCKSVDKASNNANVSLQAAGDGGSNYTEILRDGTQNTTQTEIGPISPHGSDATSVAWFSIFERNGGLGYSALGSGAGSGEVQSGRNDSITWPPGQITLSRGVSTDWTVEIYGRDF